MKAYTFSDVTIIPKYSTINTRSSVNLSTRLTSHGVGSTGLTLTLPIISANMPAIANVDVATSMEGNGGLGILHRFNDTSIAVKEFKDVQKKIKKLNIIPPCGVSLGVKETDKLRFEELYKAGARIFCIDVAHGHHILAKEMLKWLNNSIFKWARSERSELLLIAGNIATPGALGDLTVWGADIVKIGIGPGSSCTTRLDTGVGVPQLYALQEAYKEILTQKLPIQIIADGGCKCVGDIAKALKYANAVMIGKMLAGTTESPGKYINIDGKEKKIFYGSASFKNKNEKKHIEGRDFFVDKKGSIKDVLSKISDGLQSAFSYVGASNLKEFQNNCEFLEISEGGKLESKYE